MASSCYSTIAMLMKCRQKLILLLTIGLGARNYCSNTNVFVFAKNMNGKIGQYKIANPNTLSKIKYSTDYDDTLEYFDVYSPIIQTRYSEVYWTMQEPVPLPEHIQKRFINKTMAIVGYEVDQVRRHHKTTKTTNHNDDNMDIIEDIPLPITFAYNHHYMAWLLNSRKTRLVKTNNKKMRQISKHHGRGSNKHLPFHWTAQRVGIDDKDNKNSQIPLATLFSEGNGGEFRLSYHGYPKGYGQLIDSPDTFHFQPMSIDTWNRNKMDINNTSTTSKGNGSTKFIPGPIPKSSSSNHIPSSVGCSDLIECPCSSRLEIKWYQTYIIEQQQKQIKMHQNDFLTKNGENDVACADAVQNASECLLGAKQVIQSSKYTQHEISDSSKPYGCYINQHDDGMTDVIWNKAVVLPQENTLSSLSIDNSNINDRDDVTSSTLRNRIIANEKINDDRDPSVFSREMTFQKDEQDIVAFAKVKDVSVTVATGNDIVTIKMIGPADKWFGIGFGSNSMCMHMKGDECVDGGPYAIIVSNSNSSGAGDDYRMDKYDNVKEEDECIVTERKLDYHGPGTVLTKSIVVVSNDIINNNQRSVVIKRSQKGISDKHYTFDNDVMTSSSLPIIMAQGCSMEFAQHCGHGPGDLNFIAMNTLLRVCRNGIEGTIGGNKFNGYHRCAESPISDLNDQNNPTCSIKTYRGGLKCCHHKQSLLDEDQEIPWSDEYLEYQYKFRFYFEEYKYTDVSRNNDKKIPMLLLPTKEKNSIKKNNNIRNKHKQQKMQISTHQNLVRLWWQTEAFAGEYDIIPCEPGVPSSQCVQVITSHWKVRDMMVDCPIRNDGSWCTGKGSSHSNITEGVKLIYAGPHCHAPSCISMDLYNADTGRLLCHSKPVYGESDTLYDEKNYIAIPPCLWGTNEEGLISSELLSLDTTLLSIKRNNNTFPHTGEMAMWQMRGIVIPKE